MELTVLERFVLFQALPAEGSLTDYRILKDLKDALTFSEVEHKTLKFKTEGERISWSDEAEQSKEIPIGDRAKEIVCEALRRLDGEGKVSDQNYTLFEKFGLLDKPSEPN